MAGHLESFGRKKQKCTVLSLFFIMQQAVLALHSPLFNVSLEYALLHPRKTEGPVGNPSYLNEWQHSPNWELVQPWTARGQDFEKIGDRVGIRTVHTRQCDPVSWRCFPTQPTISVLCLLFPFLWNVQLHSTSHPNQDLGVKKLTKLENVVTHSNNWFSMGTSGYSSSHSNIV